MRTHAEKVDAFRSLHRPGEPLLMPNAWDVGSARLLASMGFKAIATTSSGFAATLGRLDGGVTADEAIAHLDQLGAAVDVPVSGDLENGFGDAPADTARTIERAAAGAGAGGSIEDFTGNMDDPIYPIDVAAERVRAAVDAAQAATNGFVLTARAENHIRGRVDLDDTIARLQAYAAAGADVLFAPGVDALADIARMIEAVDKPFSVLVRPGAPTVPELASVGVARVSVGGGFAYAAYGAVVDAGRELLESGTTGFWDGVARTRGAIRDAFSS